MNSKSFTPRLKKLFTVILLALFGGLMYVSQVVMASLPNIELVSLLIIILARKFSFKSLAGVYIFVLCEILTYGLHIWVINYLYVWAIFAVIICLVRKIDNAVFYAVISGAFGLAFGTLCAIPYFFTLGIAGGITYIVNGFWFDLMHCGGNFLIALILYRPLTLVFDKALKPFI